MAQSNFEERIDTYEIESTNVMTGDRDRSRYLYYQLKMSMENAKQIDIIVSFLMESCVRLYNETSRSFHPKSYIFHYESSNEIYIGSSNISKSALTSGIEWNYRLTGKK